MTDLNRVRMPPRFTLPCPNMSRGWLVYEPLKRRHHAGLDLSTGKKVKKKKWEKVGRNINEKQVGGEEEEEFGAG